MQLKKTGDTFEAQTKIKLTSSRKFAEKKNTFTKWARVQLTSSKPYFHASKNTEPASGEVITIQSNVVSAAINRKEEIM